MQCVNELDVTVSTAAADGRPLGMQSPLMSCNDFSRVAASYLLGRCRCMVHAHSSRRIPVHATPRHGEGVGQAQQQQQQRRRRRRRRLRRQNALTRASVKLSDKLVRERRLSAALRRRAYWYSAASRADNWATCA